MRDDELMLKVAARGGLWAGAYAARLDASPDYVLRRLHRLQREGRLKAHRLPNDPFELRWNLPAC